MDAYNGNGNRLERRYFYSEERVLSSVPSGGAGGATEVSLTQINGKVIFSNLKTNTTYYFYFLYHGEGGLYSDRQEIKLRTLEEVPTLAVGSGRKYSEDKEEATTTSIKFENGPEIPERAVRHFFYSTSELGDDARVYVDEDNAIVPGQEVKTFSVFHGGTSFVLGDGTTGAALEANTQYFVRYRETRTGAVGTGQDAYVHSGLSPQFIGWTRPAEPAGYEATEITATSVTFTGGGDKPNKIVRSYYGATVPLASGIGGALFVGADVGNPASVTFRGLQPVTTYHFYFMDYNPESRMYSTLHKKAMTVDAVPGKPDVYTVGSVSDTEISLTNAPAIPERAQRHLFFSTNKSLLSNPGRFPLDTAYDGTDGITSYTFSQEKNLTLSDLVPSTAYFFRIRDSRSNESLFSPLSEVFSGWTAPLAPTGYDSHTSTETSVTFTGGSTKPGNVGRRYYGVPEENKKLKMGTRYYVRALDYDSSDGRTSTLSEDLGKTTISLPTPLLTMGEITETTAEFTSKYVDTANDKLTWIIVDDGPNVEIPQEQILLAYGGETLAMVVAEGEQTESGALENEGGLTSGKIDGLEASTNYTLYAVYDRDTQTKEERVVESHEFTTKEMRPVPAPRFNAFKSVAYAYPNPTSGILYVSVSSGMAVVYASDGVKIGSFAVSAGQIDLSDLPAGNYIVRLPKRSVFRVLRQ